MHIQDAVPGVLTLENTPTLLSLQGSLTSLNRALETLTYVNREENWFGTDELTVYVNDNSVFDVPLNDTKTVLIHVRSVPDDPILSCGAESILYVTEDEASSLPTLKVLDGDGSQDRVTITMSSNGNLGLGETVARLEFTIGDPSLESTMSSTVRFTGEVSDVNHALRSLKYISALNWNSEEQGLDVVYVEVSASTKTEQQECRFYIDIKSRNDAPTIELSGDQELVTNEDEEVILSDVIYSDVDDNILNVVVECDRGTLSWNGSVVTTMHGTPETLNERDLTYAPNANYHGTDEIRIRVSDSHDAFSSITVPVTIRDVNDVPTVVVPRHEDGTTTFVLPEEGSVRLMGQSYEMGPESGDLKELAPQDDFETWISEVVRPAFDESYSTNTELDGTWQFRKIISQEGETDPSCYVRAGDVVYFTAKHPTLGRELFELTESDGNFHSRLVKDTFPGSVGSNPTHLYVTANDTVLFSADGIDSTWRLLEDKCNGFVTNGKVGYAASRSNTWDTDRSYECPYGYRWMSTEEAKELFTETASDTWGDHDDEPSYVYSDMCGWQGRTYD